MAVDRIADFVLSGISDRFWLPDLTIHNANRRTGDSIAILERDYTKDVVEIPAFVFASSIFTMENLVNYPDNNVPNKVINSIITRNGVIERRQLNTIMKDFTLRGYDSSMMKVINKGNIYYGYPGLITDSSMNTILCLKIRVHREEDKARITDYICYISPKVFTHQDGIIEKTVYKKIIPFCSSYVLHNNSPYLRFLNYNFVKYDWEGKHIEVVIRDNEECFIKPNTPRIEDFDDGNVIKDILLKNIDYIV